MAQRASARTTPCIRLSGLSVKVRCVCPEHRFGGADDRSRTCNPAITNHLRYQLPLHLHNAPQCASPLRSCPSFRAVIHRGDKDTKKTPFVSRAGIEPAIPCPDMTPARCSYPERGIPSFRGVIDLKGVFPTARMFPVRAAWYRLSDSNRCPTA